MYAGSGTVLVVYVLGTGRASRVKVSTVISAVLQSKKDSE